MLSIVIPAYNAEPYLPAFLESLDSQQIESPQLIAVDDGSTDGTAKLLRTWRGNITLLQQENLGAAAARNAGLAHARGRCLVFLDADDVLPPGRLQSQLDFLDAHGECDAVQGRMRYLRRRGTDWLPMGEPVTALSLCTAMFRREAFLAVGQLDEKMRLCEDVEWFMRAQRYGLRIDSQDAITLLHRRHGANTSADLARVKHYTLLALHRHRKALSERQR